MINSQLLRDTIDKSGLKLGFIADEMGLTRQSLTSKIDGSYQFKIGEVAKLARILGLSRKDRELIFFN